MLMGLLDAGIECVLAHGQKRVQLSERVIDVGLRLRRCLGGVGGKLIFEGVRFGHGVVNGRRGLLATLVDRFGHGFLQRLGLLEKFVQKATHYGAPSEASASVTVSTQRSARAYWSSSRTVRPSHRNAGSERSLVRCCKPMSFR